MRSIRISEKGDRRKGRQGNLRGQTPGQASSAERKKVRRKAKARWLQMEAEKMGISVAQLRARKQKEVDACRVRQESVLIQPSRNYQDYY